MSEQVDKEPQNTEGVNAEAAEGLSRENIQDNSNVVLDVESLKQHSQHRCQWPSQKICNFMQTINHLMSCRQAEEHSSQRDHRMVQVQEVAHESAFPELSSNHSRQANSLSMRGMHLTHAPNSGTVLAHHAVLQCNMHDQTVSKSP